jgi:hypothetical protein
MLGSQVDGGGADEDERKGKEDDGEQSTDASAGVNVGAARD